MISHQQADPNLTKPDVISPEISCESYGKPESTDPNSTDRPVTIESLISKENPLHDQITTAIEDNITFLVRGYMLMGERVEATRESRMRGMRNILGQFDEYRSFQHNNTDKLMKAADYPRERVEIQGRLQRIDRATNGCRDELFVIYTELAEKNDPLAVVLAHLQSIPALSSSRNEQTLEGMSQLAPKTPFEQLALDSVAVFRGRELKNLLRSRIKDLNKPKTEN